MTCCVISSFITKPQQTRGRFNQVTVALYPLSSPNHNTAIQHMMNAGLRYILFHHQTTTCYKGAGQVSCCVISSFITKPQLNVVKYIILIVALYPLSSPNHNELGIGYQQVLLRYILFHHQTTTHDVLSIRILRCVISSFITKPQLITKQLEFPTRCVISSFITKPQLEGDNYVNHECCVISSFITKPQQPFIYKGFMYVALYPLSSPNHNCRVVIMTAC